MENGRKKAHWTRFTTSRRIVRATRCAGKREQPQAFTLAIRNGLRAACLEYLQSSTSSEASVLANAEHCVSSVHRLARIRPAAWAARGQAARMSLATRGDHVGPGRVQLYRHSGSTTARHDRRHACWANRSAARPLSAALTSAAPALASGHQWKITSDRRRQVTRAAALPGHARAPQPARRRSPRPACRQ